MKIYINRAPVGDLKGWVKKEGTFLTILSGVSVNQLSGNIEIEPIYSSLARWEMRKWQIVLIVGFHFPFLMLVFQLRWPFVRGTILREEE